MKSNRNNLYMKTLKIEAVNRFLKNILRMLMYCLSLEIRESIGYL